MIEQSGTARSETTARARFAQAAERIFDAVFGPPRPQIRPDGSMSVRLLGRRFEASNGGALFDAVASEREKLLIQVGKMHEGAAVRPFYSGNRLTDSYHFHTRRMEDRVALYTAFLGRMAKDLGMDQT
jgi:hypothetical protein